MNLIKDRWIPVSRQNGEEEKIAPWELTDNFEHNPIVALAAPRPDFQGGLMQFLIGLLQTAAPPDEDNDLEWEDWFEDPPKPEKLRAKFDPFVDCFYLDGYGPRFMQDLELKKETAKVKEYSIYALLIDAPGENTVKNNTDHFVKRDCVIGMCYPCAATALFTLQTNAPSGGAGHRTSLRGGGPLTTLVALDPQGSGIETETLWHNIWLNILDKRMIENTENTDAQEHIFPWLAPARTSETGKKIHPMDVDPLQMYWGMPRRITLDFDYKDGVCDICFSETPVLVKQYVTKNYGVDYSEEWQHHLSPHRIDKNGKPSPHHPQPGGFSYRYWIGLFEGSEFDRPAKVVTEFSRRKLDSEQFRLWVFGYDMDNMKPRNWYETTFPLYLFRDVDKGITMEEKRKSFSIRVQETIEAAEYVHDLITKRIKEALNIKGSFGTITENFYANTERNFFQLLKDLYHTVQKNEDGLSILERWHKIIISAGETLFDDYTLREDVAFADMKRIVQARKQLRKDLYGNKLRNILHILK